MGREDDLGSGRDVLLGVDEDCAEPLELANDMRVVDDPPANVDGGSSQAKRLLDRLDRTFDPGAVPARSRKKDPLDHRRPL